MTATNRTVTSAVANDATNEGHHDEDERWNPTNADQSHKSDSSVELADGTRPVASQQAVYSTFGTTSKRWISFAASSAAMFSGLSSFLYYPAVNPLAESVHVSIELINLTITSYLVVSGIVPSIIGDLADRTGRRPLYLVTLTVYFLTNIGLALQDSYPALFVLRIIQSAGSSAPSLGPVLGGVISQRLGWPWTFWLLAILSGAQLLGMVMFFPETARNVVGNGSVKAQGLNRTMIDFSQTDLSSPTQVKKGRSVYWPNPLACLPVVLDRNSALVMLVGGLFYTVFSCLAASLSTICIELYELNYLDAGLVYLPAGVGGILAAYSTGRQSGNMDSMLAELLVMMCPDFRWRKRGYGVCGFLPPSALQQWSATVGLYQGDLYVAVTWLQRIIAMGLTSCSTLRFH
ncbi:MAG: hypothetical protein Q9196_005346 [Gyalolechia fulgens]